jgi:hypothetical protein
LDDIRRYTTAFDEHHKTNHILLGVARFTVASHRSFFMSQQAATVVAKVLTEDVLTLSQARKELAQVTGKRPDKATLARWIHRGVGGTKLEAVRLGCQLFTSRQAISRFIVARTQSSVGRS